jgi:hypothetical protein
MTEPCVKINQALLDKVNELKTSKSFFGTWTNDTAQLYTKFTTGEPFEHIVIDNFLEDSYAERLHASFPRVDNSWHVYSNPIEVKYTMDYIDQLPEELRDFFYHLSSTEMTNIMTELTGIQNLEPDEYLHGAGVHAHPRNGRLGVHLDYEKHPFSGKERRLNVILFLTKDWNAEEWKGDNELWNEGKCVAKTQVKFNRAILFKTNDVSWHGVPERILCPPGRFRQSLAYYYVSPLDKEKESYRMKAEFVCMDGLYKPLYEIRKTRRITQDDLDLHAPGWSVNSPLDMSTICADTAQGGNEHGSG